MWHWWYLFAIPIIASLLIWWLCKRSDVEPNFPEENDLYNSIESDEIIFKDNVHKEAAIMVANKRSKATCDHCYRFQCEGCDLFKPRKK
jgi:hypothetical protein